jgi:hypothetical protein
MSNWRDLINLFSEDSKGWKLHDETRVVLSSIYDDSETRVNTSSTYEESIEMHLMSFVIELLHVEILSLAYAARTFFTSTVL